MARSRNIKPGFFTNEELGELPPLTRLLFIGLWCLADREGRLEDRPKRIKQQLLGYDDVSSADVDKMLWQLDEKGFICRYSKLNESYIWVVNFKKHQSPHCKEQGSVIPEPDPEDLKSTGHAPCMYEHETVPEPENDQILMQRHGQPENDHPEENEATTGNDIEKSPENQGFSARMMQAPDMHGANMVQAQLIPDSLNLIPDSFNTLSPTGGPVSGERGPSPADQESTNRSGEPGKNGGKHLRQHSTTDPVRSGVEDDEEEAPGGKKKTKDEESPTWETAKTPHEKRFCTFWDAYPKKVGKLAAWRVWKRRKYSDELLNQMLETLEAWKNSWEWEKQGGQYIPHPSTWLNRGGWEDKIKDDNNSNRGSYAGREAGSYAAGFHTTADY